jgi:N-acetylmuramoyl-L-alanine amidase
LNRRHRHTLASCWLAAALSLLVGCAAEAAGDAEQRERDRFDVVIVDAGHGGEDHGARGRSGVVEKQLVLDVSRRLAGRLRDRGLTVILTRDADEFVPLETRTSVANDARGDLFISIHANSARATGARGIETFFVSLEASDDGSQQLAARENEAFDGASPASLKLDPLSAILGDMAVNEHVRESSGFAKLAHAVKQAPFVVLMGVRMPETLVEIGFLSNRDDERALGRSDRRDAIADALARAVLSFGADYDRRRGIAATDVTQEGS